MGCGGVNQPCLGKLAHGAAGLAKAGLQLFGFSIDRAPDEARAGRLEVCRGCEWATRNQKLADRPSKGLTNKSLCTKCSCLIVAKTMLASEECPIKLWPAVTPARRAKPDPGPPPPPFEDVGVVAITAFQRPAALAKLHASVRERWPKVPVLIADNGNRYAAIEDPLTTYDKLEFDCGLSAARNHLIDHFLATGRDFLALFEEDVVCTGKTNLDACLDVLAAEEEIGWVGMPLRDPHSGLYSECAGDIRHVRSTLVIDQAGRPWKATPRGTRYRLMDLTPNVGVGRRGFFQDHRWRVEAKLAEHWDFFDRVRLAAKWLAAMTPDCEADHDRKIEREGQYAQFRERAYSWQAEVDRMGGYSARREDKRVWAAKARPSSPGEGERDDRVVVVLGQGRSGSTLVQRLLNAAPGVRIAGENGGAWERLMEFAAGVTKAARQVTGAEDKPFVREAWMPPEGISGLDADCRRMLRNLYNPDGRFAVWGFKEVRHGVELVPFLLRLFPAAKLILNVRETEPCLASQVRSGWWEGPAEELRQQIEQRRRDFEAYAAAHPEHALMVRYEDLVKGNPAVAGMFAFAGADYRPEFEQPLDVVLGASSGGD